MSGRSEQYLEWFAGPDTGISSKIIWLIMMGMPIQLLGPAWPSPPLDPGDFGRCYRLLNRFPEWRQRLPEVGEKYIEWRPMIREWDRLAQMYEAAMATGKRTSRESSDMYDLMKKLLEEGGRR